MLFRSVLLVSLVLSGLYNGGMAMTSHDNFDTAIRAEYSHVTPEHAQSVFLPGVTSRLVHADGVVTYVHGSCSSDGYTVGQHASYGAPAVNMYVTSAHQKPDDYVTVAFNPGGCNVGMKLSRSQAYDLFYTH